MICEDLTILELGAASLSASLAGMVFTDNGARVVKVEPPDGGLRSEKPSGNLDEAAIDALERAGVSTPPGPRP